MVTFNGIGRYKDSTNTLTAGKKYNLISYFKPDTYIVENNKGQEEEVSAKLFTPNYCAGEYDNANQ